MSPDTEKRCMPACGPPAGETDPDATADRLARHTAAQDRYDTTGSPSARVDLADARKDMTDHEEEPPAS